MNCTYKNKKTIKERLAIASGKPVRTKKDFLVFGAPFIGQDEIKEVAACRESRWTDTGLAVARFEGGSVTYK